MSLNKDAYRVQAPKPPPPPVPEPYDETEDVMTFMRSAGRRQVLANASLWVGGVTLAFIVVGATLLVLAAMYRQREDCRAKGGTWFEDEQKCLAVREIR